MMAICEEGTRLEIEDELHSVIKAKSFMNLKFDCNRLSDGIVHRENILVDLKYFDFSFSSLRHLIENQLNIPRICQLEICIDEIIIDDFSSDILAIISERKRSKLEPIPISLRYYSACPKFTDIRNLVERFESEIQHSKYFDLLRTIELIDRHIHGAGAGWGSIEATSARLYLVDVGFIDKMYSLVHDMNEYLIREIKQQNKIMTPFGRFVSRVMRQQTPVLQIGLLVQTVSTALGMLWNFGANVEDRLYLFERGFYKLFRSILQIAVTLKESRKTSLANLGNSLFTKAFGVFGAFAETRQAALHLGTDNFFLFTLSNTLLNPSNVFHDYNSAMAAIITFYLTSHSSISQNLIASGTYIKIAGLFVNQSLGVPPLPRLSDLMYNVRYFVCLTLVNMLKTPGTRDLSPSATQDILHVWMHFLDKIGSTNIIAWFDKEHKVIWGTLEPFISLFIIPKNSFLGIMQCSQISDHDSRMIEYYLKIARFSLEVVLRLDKNREQIFEENLFTHLIFADWRVGEISQKLREYFPNLLYFPVPSLYDISALTCICEGLGEYSTFYHS